MPVQIVSLKAKPALDGAAFTFNQTDMASDVAAQLDATGKVADFESLSKLGDTWHVSVVEVAESQFRINDHNSNALYSVVPTSSELHRVKRIARPFAGSFNYPYQSAEDRVVVFGHHLHAELEKFGLLEQLQTLLQGNKTLEAVAQSLAQELAKQGSDVPVVLSAIQASDVGQALTMVAATKPLAAATFSQGLPNLYQNAAADAEAKDEADALTIARLDSGRSTAGSMLAPDFKPLASPGGHQHGLFAAVKAAPSKPKPSPVVVEPVPRPAQAAAKPVSAFVKPRPRKPAPKSVSTSESGSGRSRFGLFLAVGAAFAAAAWLGGKPSASSASRIKPR